MMKKRILILDDDWSICELLTFRLMRQGYQVTAVKDIESFYEKAFDEKPDLIILDIWLGHGLGTEVYHELLQKGFNADIPIVFISALIEDETLPSLSKQGRRFALFGKPFVFGDLLSEVRKLLNYEVNHGVS